MAAIGKIRSWGPVLVGIIALALFGFIAGDMWRSCETTGNQQRQQVGEVLGQKMSYTDYEGMIQEYENVLKTMGYELNTDEQRNELRDYVWQNFVQNTIIEKECKKLGLAVTDDEMANVLKEGTSPVLSQLRLLPQMQPVLTQFFNQQTGRFDYSQVTYIYDALRQQSANPQAAEQLAQFDSLWKLVEKVLRQQLLTNKYQNLFAGAMLSNPVSAKMAFDGQNTESKVLLASLPYNSINDNDIQIDDNDLKAKYNALKEAQFKLDQELRDVKFVKFQVKASDSDRAKLMATMNDASSQFKSDSIAIENIVRTHQSEVSYNGLPVTRAALQRISADLAKRVDSMSVGQTTEPFQTGNDNIGYTMNVVKLLGKSQQPDSIEFRQIRVGGTSEDEIVRRADSIYTALKAGAVFDSLAVKYGESAEKQWFTSAAYQNNNTNIDDDSKQYFRTIMGLGVNEVKNLKLSQMNIILQVTNRKAPVDKYDVALVRRYVDFSDSTAIAAYNTFSQFVSESQTVEALEENATKYGYTVESARIPNTTHFIANLRGTHPAVKWLFADAKVGQVSQPYDRASDQNGRSDYIVVVGLEKIHPVGYFDLDAVNEFVKSEVMKDKKFEQLAAKLNGVKSVAEAEQKGARIDTIPQVTFPTPVSLMGQRERCLSGAIAGTEKGQFSKSVVKGENGAYVFQVLDRTQREGAQFNAKNTEMQQQQQNIQGAFRSLLGDLYQKAKVVDKRYLFF